MKYKPLLIMLALICIIAVSCKNRDKDKLPEGIGKVTEYATIPSYKAMYLAISRAGMTAIKPATTNPIIPLAEDRAYLAFVWGADSADLQMSVQNKNSKWAENILSRMIDLAPKLALKDVAAKIKDNVMPMVRHGNWEMLESTSYNMQYSVEQTLLAKSEFELYTLMALGGWTQSTLQFGDHVQKSYSAEASRVLLHKEVWQSLEDNMELFSDKNITDLASFSSARGHLSTLSKLMGSSAEGVLTKVQLDQAIESCRGIKAAFSKI